MGRCAQKPQMPAREELLSLLGQEYTLTPLEMCTVTLRKALKLFSEHPAIA